MNRRQLDEFGRLDAGLGDLLRSLVESLVIAQQRLDEEHLRRVKTAEQLAARIPSGWEVLVPALVPLRRMLSEVSVGAQFRFAERAEGELGVGVELLHLAYRRRYAHSGFVSSQVTLLVRQAPLAPRGDARPVSSSTSRISREED